MIYSYDDCVAAFSRARYPNLGKPLYSNIRLFKDTGSGFRLMYKEHTIASINPDGIVTFVMTLDELSDAGILSILTHRLHKILPMSMRRVSSGRYRIGFTKPLPEYYAGIKFNLDTMQCENIKPDTYKRVDPDARKVWLRTLNKYRLGLYTRLKLGVRGVAVYETIPPGDLARWMKAGEYPDALFNVLQHKARGWATTPTYEDLTDAFVSLIATNTTPLRRAFGVFVDD